MSLTIELITKGEASIEVVLKSIESQTFQDFSIVCINSSNNSDIFDNYSHLNLKEIKVNSNTRALNARFLAHRRSSSKYSLLLDSTRPLKPNALECLVLNYSKFSAVCIREDSLGSGFWVNQSNNLRKLSEASFQKTLGSDVGYMLPRFYKKQVLDRAFDFLSANIGSDLFMKIGYGEHHLIYIASNLPNSEITLTNEVLLSHFEDSTASEIIKKYMWYGKSQRILNQIDFESNANRLLSHKRPFNLSKLRLEFETLPIRFLRITPFLLGYIFNTG